MFNQNNIKEKELKRPETLSGINFQRETSLLSKRTLHCGLQLFAHVIMTFARALPTKVSSYAELKVSCFINN